MRLLSVAEKNDAAKGIAEILSSGRFTRNEGFSKFNKLYQFEINYRGSSSRMVMTSVSGHLMNYAFDVSVKNWNSVDPIVLFDVPIHKEILPDFQGIKRTLQDQARRADVLIIWTDCDREGENIGMQIVNVCKEANRNITVLRAHFSEITHSAINRALNNLGPINENVSNAVDVRQEIDLRTGAAFTRLQSLQLRGSMPQDAENLTISYGSCQFPTLGFVVDRFREVDCFISEPFWKITAHVLKENILGEFVWKKVRLFDMDACQAIYDNLVENSVGHIIEVVNKPKSKWRPVALDTIELEKLSSRKLHITAKQTMSIAEKLYTKGYISYPRTETNIFPKDFNLQELVQVHTQDHRWGEFAQRLLNNGPRPRNGKKSDQAHPPIHPIKSSAGLLGDEARIYELIARHFLACLSQDAEGAETIIKMLVLGSSLFDVAPRSRNFAPRLDDGELFECKGLVIHKRNYLDVYPYDKWSDKEIPIFSRGEWIESIDLKMENGITSPPQFLTEADLISIMDKYGIGTDATHAEHIEKIKQRLYISVENQKYLLPEKLGMGLVEGYDFMGLEMAKPRMRAELEADLKLICEGRKQPQDVLQEQLRLYKELYIKAVEKINLLNTSVKNRCNPNGPDLPPPSLLDRVNGTLSNPSLCVCPGCNSAQLVLKRKHNHAENQGGLFLSCGSYPACRYAIWFPDSVTEAIPQLDSDANSHACFNTQKKMLKLKFANGTQLPDGRRVYASDPDPWITTCIFCDVAFREAMDIRLPNTNNSDRSISNQPASSNQLIRANSIPSNGNELVSSSVSNAMNRSDIENIACDCNQLAIKKIVRKEGQNKGREFLSCSVGQCNFFKWVQPLHEDRINTNQSRQSQHDSGSYRPQNTNSSLRPPVDTSDPSNIICHCAQPVVFVMSIASTSIIEQLKNICAAGWHSDTGTICVFGSTRQSNRHFSPRRLKNGFKNGARNLAFSFLMRAESSASGEHQRNPSPLFIPPINPRKFMDQSSADESHLVLDNIDSTECWRMRQEIDKCRGFQRSKMSLYDAMGIFQNSCEHLIREEIEHPSGERFEVQSVTTRSRKNSDCRVPLHFNETSRLFHASPRYAESITDPESVLEDYERLQNKPTKSVVLETRSVATDPVLKSDVCINTSMIHSSPSPILKHESPYSSNSIQRKHVTIVENDDIHYIPTSEPVNSTTYLTLGPRDNRTSYYDNVPMGLYHRPCYTWPISSCENQRSILRKYPSEKEQDSFEIETVSPIKWSEDETPVKTSEENFIFKEPTSHSCCPIPPPVPKHQGIKILQEEVLRKTPTPPVSVISSPNSSFAHLPSKQAEAFRQKDIVAMSSLSDAEKTNINKSPNKGNDEGKVTNTKKRFGSLLRKKQK